MTAPADVMGGLLALVRAEVRSCLTEQEHSQASGDDWIDQRRSPLGRKLHCALWRDGALPGRKVHRRVLVRRRDLDAYVEAHGLPSPAAAANDAADSETRALARVGARRVS
jgi:hypothetical protein